PFAQMYTLKNSTHIEKEAPGRGFLSRWLGRSNAKRSRERKLTRPVKRFFTRGATAALLTSILLLAFAPSAEAAITYRAKSQDLVDNGTSVSPAMPTGTVEGDLMIATVTHDSGASVITPPAGWTLIEPASRGSEQSHTRSYYRVAQSGESGPYTFSADLTNSMIAQIVTFYESTGVNVNGWTLEDSSYKYQEGAASITSTSVTGVANCLFYFAAMDDDNQAVTTPPASMAMLYETESSGNALATYYEFRGAGAVTKDITWATVDELATIAAVFSWTETGTITTVVPLVDPGWQNNRKHAVFYNGSRYFLLYSKGDGLIYYKSSPDNVDWASAGESTLSGIDNATLFDIYLVNDTKFDLVYYRSTNQTRYVRTCTISDAAITVGNPSVGITNTLTMLAVARSGAGDRIYTIASNGANLYVSAANNTGDAENVTAFPSPVNESNVDPTAVAIVPYQGTDEVLVVYTKNMGGSNADGVFSRVVTSGSGGTEVEVSDFNSLPDFSSPVSLSDTDFRIIIKNPTSGAMEEWQWNDTSWTQIDANIDPDGETDHSSPSLFYDRISGDMYAFSMDSNVERHRKPNGGSWLTEEDVDGDAGVGFYSYPITQMHEPPYGSSRTCTELVWAFRETSGTEYNLEVGSQTLISCDPSFNQGSFQARNDNGDETASTWTAAANTNWTQMVDKNFRVRFLVQETAGNPDADKTLQLEYNLNSGGWNDVTGASSVVKAAATANVTDAVDTSQQLGSGTFVTPNAGFDEADGLVGGASLDFSGNDEVEVEFSLQIVGADVSNGDTIELRVKGLNTYTNTPTVTVTGPGTFLYKKSIEIQEAEVTCTSNVTNYPAMVQLTGADFLEVEDDVDVDGFDIIFKAEDDATCGGAGLAPCILDHEIEAYDETNDLLVAWVRIPVLDFDNNTTIYLYYGNAAVTAATENGTGVWDSSYVGVWHLSEEQAGTGTADVYKDSTANANHGDDYVSATGQGGKIGSGQQFDGLDDYVDCGNKSNLDVDYITIDLWLNVNGWTNDAGILAKGDNTYRQYWMWTYGVGAASFEIDEGGNINNAWTPAGGQWQHLVLTYDGSNVTTYKSGAQENQYPQTTGPIDATIQPLLFGNIPSYNYLDGSLDEVRISNTPRNLCWIQTEHSNQDTPASFYTVGSQTSTLPPAYDQDSFRARNDNNDETTATWTAAANTNWTQMVDKNFRVRFLVQETV
ncbi:MAG: DUF2341 domain-containing protein, partial [Desulfobacteraceae bacterium]